MEWDSNVSVSVFGHNFDIVVITNRDDISIGFRVARVHAIFSFVSKNLERLYSKKMIYIEYLTPFSSSFLSPNEICLPTLSHAYTNRKRSFGVIPVEAIQMAVHLIPMFKRLPPSTTLPNRQLLKIAQSFFFNIFASHLIFVYALHWSSML